jgi:hypothetical protein
MLGAGTNHWDRNIVPGAVRTYIKFFPNAATAVAGTIDKGNVVSSIDYGSGIYTITFKDSFKSILFASAQFQGAATNTDMYCQLGDIDASAGTLAIQMKTGGTNTQPPAADANLSVFVEVVFETMERP